MNDRDRAISILKQARDMLADRLTDRVVESRDEILEDALGLSFLSEIETIYELFGSRLVHVNQLLANLPAAPEEPPGAAPQESPAHPIEVHVAASTNEPFDHGSPAVTRAYVGIVGPALHAPPAVEPTSEAGPPLTFQPFAALIHAGEMTAAGHSLARLFGLSEVRGVQCAQYFSDRMRSEPGFLLKAVQLRDELQSGTWPASMALLAECFGLSGFEALGVLQTLRTRFEAGE